MKAPRLRGSALVITRALAETRGPRTAVRDVLMASLGIPELAELPPSLRGDLPQTIHPQRAREKGRGVDEDALGPLPRLRFPREARDYYDAFSERRARPSEVAATALAELDRMAEMSPCMNLLAESTRDRTRRDAAASDERYAQGRPRGPLDGAPFLVKDEYDVEGYATRLGSRCEPDTPKKRDSTVVARLAAAGAVVLGKTVLTEWGMSPVGGNPHYRMPHNPHHSGRAPGGSSTGSAVGVAMGLGPIATAGDGGGSIRIPAALNGVFGIKPTFGRVSRAGDGFWGSVAHCGPIGASTTDLALFLDAVSSEPDPLDPLTALAPVPPARGFGSGLGAGVKGLRIGVDGSEWADADPAVAKAGRNALAVLEREGAKLIDVSVPLAKHAAKIGFLTIGPESLAYHLHDFRTKRDRIGDDVRLAFSVLDGISCSDFLDAQRLRTMLRMQMCSLLADVDVFALPTTASTAPAYTEEEEEKAFSDPAAIEAMCRFAFLGNLTGLPAATAPVGTDSDGLPIGLQIVGDAWDEITVLSVLAHLERVGAACPRRPVGGIDLLA